jgi:hypothetical protein
MAEPLETRVATRLGPRGFWTIYSFGTVEWRRDYACCGLSDERHADHEGVISALLSILAYEDDADANDHGHSDAVCLGGARG